MIAEEVQWLLANKVDFVCGDTVPLALRCAKAASIPSAVISNLSWDFIYQHFLKVCQGPELIEYKAMVEMISQDYKMADLLLRLPGAHPMPAFDHITPSPLPSSPSPSSSPLVIDMPFVVRRARRSKQEVRRALGILSSSSSSSSDSEETKLVLLVFGGQSGSVRWTPSMASLPENWVCAVCHAHGCREHLQRRCAQ